MKHLRKWAIGAVAAAACLTATSSIAASIKITFTNSQASEGLYLTPFFSTVHDGTFDIFDPNTRASDELEALAEDGNPAPLVGAATDAGFAAQVAFGPGVPPVLAPGESATVTFNGIDRLTDRFLSFASMVIPSNDIFLGNPDPIQLFDDTGAFSATAPIVLTSAQAWDGGTEANNNRGAAFNAAGGTAFDTDARIRLIGDLGFLDGQTTVLGDVIDVAAGGPVLSTIEISVVPVPASLPLLAAGLGGLVWMRRRKRS